MKFSTALRDGRLLAAFAAGFVGSAAGAKETERVEIASPDGRLVARVNLEGDGERSRLTYTLAFAGKPVIEASELGIEAGSAAFVRGLVLDGVTTRAHDATWTPVYGERSEIPDRYRETVLTLRVPGKRKAVLELVVRAYAEGIAFRYRFPEHRDGGEVLHLTKEHTQFVLPKGTLGWFAPAAQAAYAVRPLEEFDGLCERPLTLALPNGLFVSLAEAALVNHARMQFVAVAGRPGALRCALDDTVKEITPFATPWRVVLVAEKPGQLLENNFLLLNLNAPNAITDPSWIRPGKVMREMSLSTAGARAAVDFAAAHGLQFIEFDAGWYGYEYTVAADATKVNVDPRRNPRNDLDLPAAIAYATAKGIGVWLYVNQRALATQLDEILPLYQSWGVKGVKFGFVHVGSHRWTTWLHDAVKKAAAHRLMVDIHDNYRPTGFSRTYPNLLTQEGIRGNEEFPDATHNTTLPFTRFVAGAGDYTICYYRQDFGEKPPRPGAKFIKTTSAHQLSLAVIYYSPLQFLFWYDRPADYRGEPEIEFFAQVPTVWDETRVLHGEIGRFITVARRKGDAWFVGTITNNDARTLEVPLAFLSAGRSYEASIYSDDATVATRTKVGITRRSVDSTTTLRVELKASGGQAVWLRPAQSVPR